MNLFQFMQSCLNASAGSHVYIDKALEISNKIESIHGSDGVKAQAFADEALPILSDLVPALKPYALLIAIGEKYVGKAVDAVEGAVTAPVAVVIGAEPAAEQP